VRLALLGVRGSTPTPGRAYVRYGGHTSCVAVLPDASDTPALVLDAGTGLRGLTPLMGGAAFQGSVLLTHLHWDHLQGLPFCPPLDRPDSRVDLYLPTRTPYETLVGFMRPPYFPITPDGLHGTWRHLAAPPAARIEGYEVRHARICHKGGTTVGIRVESGGVSMAYLPDHSPQIAGEAALDLCADVDLLLHDGQFLAGEQRMADDYGHATIPDALRFAAECGARRLVLTHHAPGRSDDELDIIAKDLPDSVTLARQDEVLHV
jgi:ribonuclease BN (tRNA processing enzyme)